MITNGHDAMIDSMIKLYEKQCEIKSKYIVASNIAFNDTDYNIGFIQGMKAMLQFVDNARFPYTNGNDLQTIIENNKIDTLYGDLK